MFQLHSSLHAFMSKLLITLIPFMLQVEIGMILTQTKTLDFMVELPLGLVPGWGQGSECITSHIKHMQNSNRIINLVPLLALES